MRNLLATNQRIGEFADHFNKMTRAVDEKVALYVRGHHSIEEQLHDSELTADALQHTEEVAKLIDQVAADLMEFKLHLIQSGVNLMPALLKAWAHLDRPAPVAPPTPQVTFDTPPVGHQSLLGYYGSDWGWKPISLKNNRWHCEELGILNHSVQPFKFALPGDH